MLTETDPLHLQARVRAAMLGLAVTVEELAPTLAGEPRFAVVALRRRDRPPLGSILDALPADLEWYVVVEW